MTVNVVWFKRDLRIDDHQPLLTATMSDLPCILLYVIEDDYWQLPDTSLRQFTFIKESLISLAKKLNDLGGFITIRRGDVKTILTNIHTHLGINKLLSHIETGNDWTFKRDLSIKKWARENQVYWQEFSQKPVVRGLLDRNNWQSMAHAFYEENGLSAPTNIQTAYNRNSGLELLNAYAGNDALNSDSAMGQHGGLESATSTLDSFVESRVKQYLYGISSPLKSIHSSSRLSPYLAYGVLSLKQVMHRAWEIDKSIAGRSKNGFISRLHWHSHFIQKFETEPEHEFRSVNKSLDGMRRDEFNDTTFSLWKSGNTGVPFVDACMRMLASSGWINFRMRAMLTAYSSYQLWLHWQKPAQHLAQLFTDYEPGIHYPQIQMQSGVTGINPFRMYNPVLQGKKYDSNGQFVRRWIPELNHVPDTYLQQPWFYSGLKEDCYPKSVPPEQLAKEAKIKIKAYYAANIDQREKQRVVKVHASRSRKKRAPKKVPETTQLKLL